MTDLGDFKRVVHDPQVRALREKNWELRASLQAAEAEVLGLRERHREAMALVLDMGEFIRNVCDPTDEWESSLLARLDQLGKEQT